MSLLLIIDVDIEDFISSTNISLDALKTCLLKSSIQNQNAVSLLSQLCSPELSESMRIFDLTKPLNLEDLCHLRVSMKKSFIVGICREMSMATELFMYKSFVKIEKTLDLTGLKYLGISISDTQTLTITSSPVKQRELDYITRRLKAIASIQKRILSFEDLDPELAKLNHGKPKSTKLIDAPVVGGYAEAKVLLDQSITWFFQKQEEFSKFGITPSKGALLFGPPGCGKTLIAKSIASKTNANFIPVQLPEIVKGFVGDSEKALHNIFENAKKNSPSILFLDEIDSLFNSDDHALKITAQLISELDDLGGKQVVVLAATNYKEKVNKSILRSGRIDTLVEIGLPTSADREDIFKVLFSKLKLEANYDLEMLVNDTVGMTGSDLNEIVRRASILAVSRDLIVTNADLQIALHEIKDAQSLRLR